MVSERLGAGRRMGSPPASGLDHVPTQAHVTNLRREWRAMAHAGVPGPRCLLVAFYGSSSKDVHVRRRVAFPTHNRSASNSMQVGQGDERRGRILSWLSVQCQGLKVIMVKGSMRHLPVAANPRDCFLDRWAAGLTVQEARFHFESRLSGGLGCSQQLLLPACFHGKHRKAYSTRRRSSQMIYASVSQGKILVWSAQLSDHEGLWNGPL